jgi:2,4-dienoyl-CoA reductase-like NADH-dependent reductase (Old Yellow Enzyme family)/thioredoxin reductase
MDMRYPSLFSEGTIGSLTLKNRTVLAPMVTGLANYDGTPSEELTAYYEQRAKNGLGLLITGATRVNYVHGVIIPRQLSMTGDRHIAPFGALVDRLHRHGTKVMVQLHHPGRQGLSPMGIAGPSIELMGRAWPGFYKVLARTFPLAGAHPELAEWYIEHSHWPAVVAPSNVPSRLYNQRTRALRRSEVRGLVDDFVAAAGRVKASGADGVQLHGAHGYLIQQFLSPHTNLRKDEYGGGLDNRMRFLLEIVDGIRRECGSGFPLTVRLTVDEYYRVIGMPGEGIELEEGVEIARRLEKAGVDAIDVSSATYENTNYWLEPMSFEFGWRKHLAREVKKAVSIPVIAANAVRTPEQGEALLAEGTQDFISLGRPLLADPAWISKAMEGREEEIRRCISCLWCIESLTANSQVGRGLECAVNATTGRETIEDVPGDGLGRVVAVVGAGPAGLSAAEELGARGFKPVVLERTGSAGGQLKLASVPPGKSRIEWCVEDLEAAALRQGAEIRYGVEASREELDEMGPDAVIVATGAGPLIPRIPGVEGGNVCTVNDVLDGCVRLKGKRVAVIGAGMTGLETADALAEAGNAVLVVEMADRPAPGAFFQLLEDVQERLERYGVEILTSHKLISISEDCITLEDLRTRRREDRGVDAVVLALGVRSDDRLAKELSSSGMRVFVVGDARCPGRIHDAVREGFDAAREV